LAEANAAVVISNGTVFALHGQTFIKDFLPGHCPVTPLIIGDGEKYKTHRTVNMLYDHLFDIGLERQDAIIALGGGVVGDTAGFVAATYKRGVTLIQVPTTLLSMVDSSVGGKTGVNHRRGKNLIGAFYQPRAVIVNPAWLGTLGRREMTEGLAEIIKAGFLSSAKLLRESVAAAPVYSTRNKAKYISLIRSAILFKSRIVARDVHDLGVRAILNFGHTFGHAIEKAEGYRKYHHGEAVLAGMIGALYLSHVTGRLSRARMMEYLDYLRPFVADLRPLKRESSDYISPMSVDKKGRGGRRVFVLLDKIGCPVVRVVRSHSCLKESVEFMKTFVNNRGEG
jgi:3-dehydroquinate synthase